MSETSDRRSDDFLKISDQFQLGVLTTESSHPVTANLSDAARANVAEGVRLLFEADRDVLKKYREFVASNRAGSIQQAVLEAVRRGGKVFFTGCGSTGRLSIQLVSIWRDFWQRRRAQGWSGSPTSEDLEHRAFSVMAGGDYALIKSVEGFEDFTVFGKQQIRDLGVGPGDVVFAITEGGETSFVIGTAWKGIEAGAKVYFVYNNPDHLLCQHVVRSREVIEDPRIEKINLTTGPMSITGSTRMQATTIQLCVMLTVMEMVFRQLLRDAGTGGDVVGDPDGVPQEFECYLAQIQSTLLSAEVCGALGRLVEMEEGIYRSGHKNNYYAGRFGIDMLTDTTERSPTYCTPPFRKFDDTQATESWAFLFVPELKTPEAWRYIIKRQPKCVEWTEPKVRELVGYEKAARTYETVRKISASELMRFKVGLDGLEHRRLRAGDSAVALVAEAELDSLLLPGGFHREQLEGAHRAGARVAVMYLGSAVSLSRVQKFMTEWNPRALLVSVEVPQTGLLLEGVTRAGVKMLLNTLSTCTMVRLGRVMGNYMIWVVPSNLKLIDRATRYVQRLTNLEYKAANRLLFEVIEYVEPRMKADQAYPPVVGVSVMRARHGLTNEQAEKRILEEVRNP